MKDLYYVIISNGTAVDVQESWAGALSSQGQWNTPARPAEIVPVVPRPPKQLGTPGSAETPEFVEEEPTAPNPEPPGEAPKLALKFDLSDQPSWPL